MCSGGGGRVPAPPPLPPPPPPPFPPKEPVPEPDPIVEDVNPNVRSDLSQKKKNPYAKGTEDLRIDIDPNVGGTGPGGQAGQGAGGGGTNP